MIRPTTFNITTLLLLGLTCWILYYRHRARLDTSWPLFYYIALVAFANKFDETVNGNLVFIGVVSAALLRFEFMSGWVLQGVKYIESGVLIYVILRCTQLIFG